MTTATFETLMAIDARLVRKGHHPISPFWAEHLRRFYDHPTAKSLIARVGRGGAKSFTSVKVSLNEVLSGTWDVGPGQRHYWAYISTTADEARQRLALIERFLRDLGVRYKRHGDQIDLVSKPLGWRVMAAQVSSVSGFRCMGASLDELAKYPNTVESSDSAEEIAASVRAMAVTHPGARFLLISSPVSTRDYHYKRFEQGESSGTQITCWAPSWTANPGITQAQTLRNEPDTRFHSREYGAVPADYLETDYFGTALQNIVRPEPLPVWDARYFVAIDQAFQHDRFGWAVASCHPGEWDTEHKERAQKRITHVREVGAWKPDRSPREMARRLYDEVCRRYGTNRVYGDQYGGLPFAELAKDVGIKLTIVPWTGGDSEGSKADRFRRVRLAMHEGAFRVPPDDALLQELRSVRSVITPAGNERIEVPRTTQGHGDRVSAMVLAGSLAMAGPVFLAPERETFWEKRARKERERDWNNLLASL